MIKNSVPNIWIAQEKMLHLYRLAALGLGIVTIALVAVLVVQTFRNPIVIVRTENAQEFYPTDRRKTPIEKADVEAFTKRYLASLYTWMEFDGGKIGREIGPFSEDALVAKVVDAQSQKYVKGLKGKHLAQAITFVDVQVLDDRVVCRFDRVLKIEGLPLVIPTEVTLSLVQGEQTRLNPIGIYVAAIMENDSAK